MGSILESQDEIPFGVHDLIEGKIDKDGRKSAVAPCHERSFLGFSFTTGRMVALPLKRGWEPGMWRGVRSIL
jgi:hypothetical protein